MSILVLDEVETPRVVRQSEGWVLVLDQPSSPSLLAGDTPADFILLDPPPPATKVIAVEPDVLLIDRPNAPRVVDLTPSGGDIVLVSPGGTVGRQGDPGPQGEKGDKGDQGDPGVSGYEYTRNFASPSTIWELPHNFGITGLQITCWDTNGDVIVGDPSYPDENNAQVEWFYPTAGSATAWR